MFFTILCRSLTAISGLLWFWLLFFYFDGLFLILEYFDSIAVLSLFAKDKYEENCKKKAGDDKDEAEKTDGDSVDMKPGDKTEVRINY